jgi:hypothetical protein
MTSAELKHLVRLSASEVKGIKIEPFPGTGFSVPGRFCQDGWVIERLRLMEWAATMQCKNDL